MDLKWLIYSVYEIFYSRSTMTFYRGSELSENRAKKPKKFFRNFK